MIQEQQQILSYLDIVQLRLKELFNHIPEKERPFFDPESPEILRQRCE